jgi:ABC-type Fe3+ transport system permease subunit
VSVAFSGAEAELLARSLGLALAAGVLALFLGGGSALALGRDRGPWFVVVAGLWASTLATGPGLWAALASRLSWLRGAPAAVYVAAGALAPLPFAALAAVRTALDPTIEESAHLALGHARARVVVLLPLLAPVALAATLLVVVLAFGDAAIPSAMGARTAATEALAAATLGLGPSRAVVRGIIPVGVLAALLLPLAGRAVPVFTAAATTARAAPGRVTLALALTAVAVVPPLAAAVASVAGRESDVSGVFVPLVTSAAGAIPVALGVVVLGAILSRLGSTRLVGLAVLALAIPPPLLGSTALALLTAFAPALRHSTAPFVVVSTLRLAPLAAVLIATVAERRPASWFEGAHLAGLSRWRTFSGISLPSLAGPALAAGVLAFLLSFHDVVLALMLDPPGVDRLGPAVFSRLGVGSASTTALLALTPAAATTAAIGVGLLLRRFRLP